MTRQGGGCDVVSRYCQSVFVPYVGPKARVQEVEGEKGNDNDFNNNNNKSNYDSDNDTSNEDDDVKETAAIEHIVDTHT